LMAIFQTSFLFKKKKKTVRPAVTAIIAAYFIFVALSD